MTSQRSLVLGAVGALALIAAFWFMVLAPKREEISTVTAGIEQAEQRRSAAAAAVAQAEEARAGYQNDYATVARIGKAVPQDDDIASLVYQLETIAKRHDVDFRAVKLTGQTAAAAEPAAAQASAAGKGADAKPGDKPPEGGEAATAPTAAAVVAQPPPGAVVGTAGLLTVPFTFTFNGDYLKLQRFLKAIDGLANGKDEKITVRGRLLTVDGFSLAAAPPPEGFPKLKAEVSATAYLAPPADSPAAAPGQAAGATAGAPTTTAMTSDAQGAGR